MRNKNSLIDARLNAVANFLDRCRHGDSYPHEKNTPWGHKTITLRDFESENLNTARNVAARVIYGGLKNPANFCFMNAVIQAICSAPSLQDQLYRSPGSCGTPRGQIACVWSLLQAQAALLRSKNRAENILEKIIKKIVWSDYEYARQHDAHEFATHLLASIPIQCKACRWVLERFSAKMQSTVECRECLKRSTTSETCFDLCLCVRNQLQPCTVTGMLQAYTAPYELCGPNSFFCGKCNRNCDATKTTAISDAPNLLMLTLNRFRIAKRIRKVHTPLDLEMELDLGPFLNNPSNDNRYCLWSGVCHSGPTPSNGHYYAFARGQDEKWRIFNDSIVSETSEDDVRRVASSAYLLFYERTKGSICNNPTDSCSTSVGNSSAMESSGESSPASCADGGPKVDMPEESVERSNSSRRTCWSGAKRKAPHRIRLLIRLRHHTRRVVLRGFSHSSSSESYVSDTIKETPPPILNKFSCTEIDSLVNDGMPFFLDNRASRELGNGCKYDEIVTKTTAMRESMPFCGNESDCSPVASEGVSGQIFFFGDSHVKQWSPDVGSGGMLCGELSAQALPQLHARSGADVDFDRGRVRKVRPELTAKTKRARFFPWSGTRGLRRRESTHRDGLGPADAPRVATDRELGKHSK